LAIWANVRDNLLSLSGTEVIERNLCQLAVAVSIVLVFSAINVVVCSTEWASNF
jgi:hypothetical protein